MATNDRIEARLAVTAAVTVRNGADYLTESLGAILRQTRPVDEILVVDGHSTDDTVAIAKSLGARVVVQPGRGIPDGYNTAVREATHPVIAFCSHDDRWEPNKIEVQLGHLELHPAIAFSHAHFIYETEPGWRPPPGFDPKLLGRVLPGPFMETLVARRTVFDLIGGFDSAFPTGHDVDWLARAHDAGLESVMLTEVLLRKRLHESNASLNAADTRGELLGALRRSIKRKQEGRQQPRE